MKDGNGNGHVPDGFVFVLRQVMKGWGWTPSEIEASLPRLVRILVDLGMLRRTADGSYETTERVEDDEAWREVWAKAREEGIGGTSPAS